VLNATGLVNLLNNICVLDVYAKWDV